MVRSGHHRKRSLSRSLSPNEHKRVKSSHRDREKERSRRRSRSRERPRRSRSRDRKIKDKRPSESRVRSKPLKLKRRSKSRSRSRSREHTAKKEEKKEIKAEDEPFDPTNLDKQKSKEETAADEDWIVTDMVQENSPEEDNIDENMQCNDVDENSCNNNQIRNEILFNPEENSYNNNNEVSKILEQRSDSISASESSDYHDSSDDDKMREKAKILIHSTNRIKAEGVSHVCNDYDIKLMKDKIDLELTQSRELHQLIMKNKLEKHNAEMELIKLQIEYWQLKYSKGLAPMTDSRSETCHVANEVTHSTDQIASTNQENQQVYTGNQVTGNSHLPEEVSTTSRSIITSQVTGTCHFIESNEATKKVTGGIEVVGQVSEEVVVEVNA